MAKPRLSGALTWPKYEKAVLAVFTEALRRLAEKPNLPRGEEPINLVLYWLCLDVHLEQMNAKRSLPFIIDFDATNQPEPDDTAESRRLKKRPDFACAIFDHQAPDAASAGSTESVGRERPAGVLQIRAGTKRLLARSGQYDHSHLGPPPRGAPTRSSASSIP